MSDDFDQHRMLIMDTFKRHDKCLYEINIELKTIRETLINQRWINFLLAGGGGAAGAGLLEIVKTFLIGG